MKLKKIFSSQITVTALVIVLAIMANLKFRQWNEDKQVQKLKNSLLEQADAQQKKNQELSDSIHYLNSNNFKEQVARTQLNLKKQGEVVYSLNNTPDATSSVSVVQHTEQSNAAKWWDYFFNKNNNESVSS